MTVKELINVLEKYDSAQEVYVEREDGNGTVYETLYIDTLEDVGDSDVVIVIN